MTFNCMATAVVLIVSVMAIWPANERFTYGYGRIETLSGFANGIFLILISIFIMFEAIQRMWVAPLPRINHSLTVRYSLDPPEMNTSQLLLVSSLGLGVDLFGMFAMGDTTTTYVRHVTPRSLEYANLLIGTFAFSRRPQSWSWTFPCTAFTQVLRNGECVCPR